MLSDDIFSPGIPGNVDPSKNIDLSNRANDLSESPRISTVNEDIFAVGHADPGKTIDLSGRCNVSVQQPANFVGSSSSGGSSRQSSGRYNGLSNGSAGQSNHGPTSIEGGRNNNFSIADLTPANVMRQLASRPITDLVQEHGRQLLTIPRYMVRAYTSAAQRYLQPWNKFMRIRPTCIIEGVREASHRGEVQVYFQRNIVANVRDFFPNYAFMFLAMLFWFVCTSPMLLMMLGGVGGGWSHALRSEQFRNRPWILQIGSVQVPLGANLKMAIMALPTLLFLHFFMAPVLWPAALCTGGVTVAHAALRDRDGDHDEDHGFGSASVQAQELP